MSIDEALEIAESEGLNLVAMNEDKVPICKLMDYSKFLYNKKKAAKNNVKSRVELKEIKFNPNIAEYDMEIKAKNVGRILGEGDKVKITITYKGRTVAFIKSGLEKMEQFETMIEAPHNVDRKPTIEGNRVYMVVSPAK